MTERVKALRKLIVTDKAHHAFRRAADIDPSVYRRADLKDFQRTALRLKTFLEAETPVILPGDLIDQWIDPAIDASKVIGRAVNDVVFETA